jgi:GNAT superfamily N-acetyltransferase
MGPLSNFLRKGDARARGSVSPPPAARGTLACRAASHAEIKGVIAVVLSHAGRPPEDEHLLQFMQFAVRRGINLGDAWLAERDGRLVWALLPVVSPGRTMLLLTPAGDPPRGDAAAAGELIERVCAHFGGQGVHLAQVLLDPADEALAGVYEGQGFRRMAELIYLQGSPRRAAQPPRLPDGFAWQPYSGEVHARFAATIAASYRDSLDCPALNGVRDMEDIITGHKASGDFDPRLWLLLCEGGAPLAVLLLARVQPGEAMELVYLGLVPAARGRGLGDVLMRHALALTAADRLPKLSLAVDADNAPALKLYYRHGLQRVGSKVALIRELRARPIPSDAARADPSPASSPRA